MTDKEKKLKKKIKQLNQECEVMNRIINRLACMLSEKDGSIDPEGYLMIACAECAADDVMENLNKGGDGE